MKGAHSFGHSDLGKLRVLLVGKYLTLSRIPPSEPSFLQHVLQAFQQIRIWMSAHLALPLIQSPELHGWSKIDDAWTPKFFDGPTAAEVPEDLLCSCHGRAACANNCICYRNGIECAEECLCKWDEDCMNELTHQPMGMLSDQDDIS